MISLLKKLTLVLAVFGMAALSGCSKPSGGGSTANFTDAFKKADPALKAKADMVASAFKTNGHMVAIQHLKDMREIPALPDKLDSAILDMMELVMADLNQKADKGNPEAIKTREDLKMLRRR